MKYVGIIQKKQGNSLNTWFYNFIVMEYIDDKRGIIRKASDRQIFDDIKRYCPKYYNENRSKLDKCSDNNQITIWVKAGNSNEGLDELADGRKLVWNLNLENNVELRVDKLGLTTVKDYTWDNDIDEINSSFLIARDNYEKVTGELKRKLVDSKSQIEQWIQRKEKEYSVKIHSISSKVNKEVVEKINELFPDFNKPNYVEIYGDPDRTAAYLLKYGFAYTYLYKSIYKNIMELMDENEKIDVLSIGCGARIDMLGLKLAILDTNKEKAAYYGIDLNDWTDNNKTNFCLFPQEGCFEEADITDFLGRDNNTYNHINSNIILFPYSMSELVDNVIAWNSVLNNLPARLTSKNVYVATNIRSYGNEEKDEKSFLGLVSKMEEAGYRRMGDICSVRGIDGVANICDTEEGKKLAEALNIGSTKDNEETVAGYLQSIKRYDKNNIKCNPILSADYIRYNIAKFTKEKIE